LAEIIPIEIPAVLKFLHQPRGIEGIPRLPELEDNETADERLIVTRRILFPSPSEPIFRRSPQILLGM